MLERIDAADTAAYPIALGRLTGVGRRTVAAILRAFPARPALERATHVELESALGSRAAGAVRRGMDDGWASAQERADDVIGEHRRNGFAIVSMLDPTYPALLRLTDDPPVVLFVKGDPDVLDAPLVTAVVGTRTPTMRGVETARRLSQRLGDLGVVVVSGLAKGIDTAAHEGALDTGRTIAVLGTAIDKTYPAENRRLADAIASSGALVSEYPIGSVTKGQAFVERDRIQAGLSVAVIPVQTGLSGGTQHTIKFAQEARRALLVPQPSDAEIDARENEGILDLLSRGVARPISAVDLPELVVDWAKRRSDLLEKSTTEAPPKAAKTKGRKRAKAASEAETLSWLPPPEAPGEVTFRTMDEVIAELDRTLDRVGPGYDEAAFDSIVRAWRARRFG
jgi:DNA processing protein